MKRSEFKLRKFARRKGFKVTVLGSIKNEGFLYKLEKEDFIWTVSTLQLNHMFIISGGNK